MRSREEQRQQNISNGGFRQREAVKPRGYAEAPSSSSVQVGQRVDKQDDARRLVSVPQIVLQPMSRGGAKQKHPGQLN